MRLTQRRESLVYSLTLSLSAYLWIYVKGPFIDTSFELGLLQESRSFGDYLELIKLDNQPPGQKMINYFVFALTNNSMNLTRFITTLLLGISIYLTYRWYLRVSKGRPSSYAFFFFLLVVCVGPAIMSALSIQRYSSSAAVLWCAVILVSIVAIREQKTSLITMSGLLTSMALFFSYTSIVLAITVFVFILWVDRRLIPAYLMGSIPGLIASVTWFNVAGENHRDLVFAKGAMPPARQVGALWENTFWFFFGPASLPSVYFALLLALTLVSLFIVRKIVYSVQRQEAAFLVAQLILPALVFSYAGLANANMAGPSLAVIIYLVARARDTVENRLASRLSLGYLLILPIITSTFVFANFNVLRPYYWSNASIQVVYDLERIAKDNSFPFYSLIDINLDTQVHDSKNVAFVDVRENQRDIAAGSYFVFSDEVDKSQELGRFMEELQTQGLRLELITEYGGFTQTASRQLLGMYNTQGAQYYLYRITTN